MQIEDFSAGLRTEVASTCFQETLPAAETFVIRVFIALDANSSACASF